MKTRKTVFRVWDAVLNILDWLQSSDFWLNWEQNEGC